MKHILFFWFQIMLAHLKHFISIAFFYILLAVVITYPAVLNFQTNLIGDGGDNIEYYSNFFLVKQNLSQGQLPFSDTTTFRYPFGFNFAGGSDARLMTFLGGLGLFITEGPVVYNSLFLLILTLNCTTAYLLFKTITKSSLSAFIGGLIYGMSYYVLTRGAGHFNLFQVYGFPILVLGLLKIKEHKVLSTKWMIVVGLSLLLLALSSVQYLLIGVSLLLVFGLYLIFFEKHWLQRAREYLSLHSLDMLIVLASILVIFWTIFSAHVTRFTSGDYPVSRVLQDRFTPLMVFFHQNDFLVTPVGKMLAGVIPILPADIESALYLGLLEIVLFGVFLSTT